jgi:hypothetical protein
VADLTMDLDAVRTLGDSLSVVAGEFEDAGARSDRIADAVGHDRLAGVVRDFASSWDDTRAKMTTNLRLLADSATQVAQAFTDVDADLAAGIQGDPSVPASARPGGPA